VPTSDIEHLFELNQTLILDVIGGSDDRYSQHSAVIRSALQEISAPSLFPNENMGLNLPFAIGLVFVKLNRASGQHGRFLASYQRCFEA
jgi:hypothetical protein